MWCCARWSRAIFTREIRAYGVCLLFLLVSVGRVRFSWFCAHMYLYNNIVYTKTHHLHTHSTNVYYIHIDTHTHSFCYTNRFTNTYYISIFISCVLCDELRDVQCENQWSVDEIVIASELFFFSFTFDFHFVLGSFSFWSLFFYVFSTYISQYIFIQLIPSVSRV